MMRLELVKTAEEETTYTVEKEDKMLHDTCVLLYLTDPWEFTGRIVVGDSSFALGGAAETLNKIYFGFIGVVPFGTPLILNHNYHSTSIISKLD